MKSSNFLSLNWDDFLNGAVVAIITGVLATLATLLESGSLFDKGSLIIIGTAALSAFVAYIAKNLFTNSKRQFLKTEL